MKKFLFAIGFALIGCSAAQAWLTAEEKQELLDHMFLYDNVCYSVTSEEEKTAAVFDPQVFDMESGMYEGDIVVHEKVKKGNGEEYTVTEIIPRCFSYCNNLTSVTLPETITSMTYVFVGCGNLKNISVGSDLKYIIDCFNSLPEWDITEFTVPSSVDTLDSSFNDIRV